MPIHVHAIGLHAVWVHVYSSSNLKVCTRTTSE